MQRQENRQLLWCAKAAETAGENSGHGYMRGKWIKSDTISTPTHGLNV